METQTDIDEEELDGGGGGGDGDDDSVSEDGILFLCDPDSFWQGFDTDSMVHSKKAWHPEWLNTFRPDTKPQLDQVKKIRADREVLKEGFSQIMDKDQYDEFQKSRAVSHLPRPKI